MTRFLKTVFMAGSLAFAFSFIHLTAFADEIVLQSGVPEAGGVLQGQWAYYQINATASHTQIVVELTGLSNDVDLYVRAGALPTLGDYDCRPYEGGTSSETCTLPNSGATTWYIGVYGYKAGSYTVEATLSGGGGPTVLNSGVPQGGSVLQGQWAYYQIDATASHTQIVVELTGLSNDVDLYVRAGALPTLGDYDCRPYEGGTSSETCTLPNSGATTWYIGVYGYKAGSYTVEATLSGGGGPTVLNAGVPQGGSVLQGQWAYYQIDATASHTQIVVELTGLSNDVDLYVRAGVLPTLGEYDCRPYEGGTSLETCTLPNSGATTWYIGVYGYKAGSYTVEATLSGGGGGPACPDFENITEDIGRGFGSTNNKYAWSMAAYNGNIYVGTLNTSITSDGGEVWKYSVGSGAWTRIINNGGTSTSNRGFRNMMVYNDKLYTGSGVTDNPELYEIDDSDNWQVVGTVGYGSSIRGLAVHNGLLYIGTEDEEGGEIWTYDGSNFEFVLKLPDTKNMVSALYSYEGTLYAGTWDDFGLYEIGPSGSYTDITPNISAVNSDSGVMVLIEYLNRLYLGTMNWPKNENSPFSLIYTLNPGDPDAWTVMTTNGFGHQNSQYAWIAKVFEDRLYVGVFNPDTLGKLYVIDGNTWELCVDDGFDGVYNWGLRSMEVYQGRLYIGTASEWGDLGDIYVGGCQVYATAPTSGCTDSDGDGVTDCDGDCDDSNDSIYPGAPELCDGLDNDCDGQVDEGLTFDTYYRDADGDNYGDAGDSLNACSTPSGYVADNTDCDDDNASINPGAAEICDGVDNNCDGEIDEGFVLTTYYRDADGDTYGDAGDSIEACSAPVGYVEDYTDCDDSNNTIYPGADELCDGLDNNCNGTVDEGAPPDNIFYEDFDGDTFGNAGVSVSACLAPAGYVDDDSDCDDTNDAVNPNADEDCDDGIDNDCDGDIDSDDSECGKSGCGAASMYRDGDGMIRVAGTGSLVKALLPLLVALLSLSLWVILQGVKKGLNRNSPYSR